MFSCSPLAAKNGAKRSMLQTGKGEEGADRQRRGFARDSGRWEEKLIICEAEDGRVPWRRKGRKTMRECVELRSMM